MMNTILTIIIVVSLATIFWAYFGYFIFLKALALFRFRTWVKKDWTPPVSLIITAFNEEKRIGPKIENSLSLDYPAENFEIIVVSDGSTDKTVEIARLYGQSGVKLLQFPERHGKHYCQGKGIESASHDIFILSDATTFLEKSAIKKIVRNFADPDIGVVSGMDAPEGIDGKQQGENIYVRYEMALRRLESKAASIVGASGSFYAVRRDVCRKWYPDLSSDFYLPLLARTYGYRAVLDEEAIGFYKTLEDPQREFQRKVRTIVHGLDVIYHLPHVLNPFRYGLLAFQIFSHKIARWLVPFAMIMILICNIPLAAHGRLWLVFLVAQLVFYLIAITAWLSARLRKMIVFKIPLYFVMANLSILAAWYDFIRGERHILWQSTKR